MADQNTNWSEDEKYTLLLKVYGLLRSMDIPTLSLVAIYMPGRTHKETNDTLAQCLEEFESPPINIEKTGRWSLYEKNHLLTKLIGQLRTSKSEHTARIRMPSRGYWAIEYHTRMLRLQARALLLRQSATTEPAKASQKASQQIEENAQDDSGQASSSTKKRARDEEDAQYESGQASSSTKKRARNEK